MKKLDKLKVEILVPRKPFRTDSFFYAKDDAIAEIKYNGYVFYAWACGDIRVINKKTGEEFTNRNVSELFHLTNKTISDEYFEWLNNNWFEISAINPKKEFIDLSEIANDYDDAIETLKSVAENKIKEWGV